jgi:transglutaminase-like putative cysteine protease
MRLKVHHTTRYEYDSLPIHIVQRLHLEPADFATQRNVSWTISVPDSENMLRYRDGFGNWVHLVTFTPKENTVAITAEGEVETQDAAGVVKGLPAATPETVFLRATPATSADKRLQNFADDLAGKRPSLELAHTIMQAVHGAVAYEIGSSHAHTTAAEAFADGRGVCQDHAHIMLAVARRLGIPARYVTGYLVTGEGASSTAAHAWAELFISDLGWVGFDAANGQCPTDHYVRVAAGHDAAAVSPVKGSRRGAQGSEHLRVEVRVEISQQ